MLKMLQQMPTPPHIAAANTAVHACARAGDADRALSLLEAMRRRGPEPDSVTYASALEACAHSRLHGRALELFEQLQASPRIVATLCVYNSLLDAVCGRAEARPLWERALEAGVYPAAFAQSGAHGSLECDFHGFSEGAAETALRWLLESGESPRLLVCKTGWGKGRAPWNTSDLRLRVLKVLRSLRWDIVANNNPGRVVARRGVLLDDRSRT